MRLPLPMAAVVPEAVTMERRAVPLADPMAWTKTSVRLVVLLCALALASASIAVTAEPAFAQDVTARIASIRAAQASAERSMRALDAQVERLSAQRKSLNQAAKSAERERNKMKAAVTSAKAVLIERTSRLARLEAQYASPNDAPYPDIYRERLRTVRGEVRVAEARRANLIKQMQAQTRVLRSKRVPGQEPRPPAPGDHLPAKWGRGLGLRAHQADDGAGAYQG